LVAEKNQLASTLLEHQKKEGEDKIKLYQSQSLKSLDIVSKQGLSNKPSEMDRLTQELNVKTSELTNISKTLKSIQQRYAAL
jgi:hypothetical protein